MLRFSRMLAPGTEAPAFSLPDPSGKLISIGDVAGKKGLLVAFICNHCPFVQHVLPLLSTLANQWVERGLGVVAISSNDVEAFPEDAPQFMADVARQYAFAFPYLYDEDQQVALAYEAICTPDFFLFDADLKLFYTGQFDPSRPKINRPPMPGHPLPAGLPITGADLGGAVEALLSGAAPPENQVASAGCSIKWKDGVAPEWA